LRFVRCRNSIYVSRLQRSNIFVPPNPGLRPRLICDGPLALMRLFSGYLLSGHLFWGRLFWGRLFWGWLFWGWLFWGRVFWGRVFWGRG